MWWKLQLHLLSLLSKGFEQCKRKEGCKKCLLTGKCMGCLSLLSILDGQQQNVYNCLIIKGCYLQRKDKEKCLQHTGGRRKSHAWNRSFPLKVSLQPSSPTVRKHTINHNYTHTGQNESFWKKEHITQNASAAFLTHCIQLFTLSNQSRTVCLQNEDSSLPGQIQWFYYPTTLLVYKNTAIWYFYWFKLTSCVSI